MLLGHDNYLLIYMYRIDKYFCFFFVISRGAESGPRAPPLGLNPMHILLYPRG